MFTSLVSLTMILMVLALKNSNLQALPKLHLVDFNMTYFSNLTGKLEILLRESHESPKNVTLQQTMSQESYTTEARWD